MNRIEDLETALDIGWAQVDHLRVTSVRRQTGPGLMWDRAGAVMDIYLDGPDPDAVIALWDKHARAVLDALDWTGEDITTRRFTGGMNLAISAPLDQLYSAVFAVQTAWHFCAAELAAVQPGLFKEMIADLKIVMEAEANPALIALIAAAKDHGVDILCDDDHVSIGHGTGSQTWPATDLPAPEDVAWATLHDVPFALITGTNGKTTTTRLCAAIARGAGHTVGLTSTDMVQVGDDILDRGDYSGPAGGRMVLRDPRVEIACLEVARGGILRWGLPTSQAKVAVVTNIAKDHLGEYGVMTLPELADAKFAVARALAPAGVLVLNADDPEIVKASASVDKQICWFSQDANNVHIKTARQKGVACAYLDANTLTFFDGTHVACAMPVSVVPMTLNGAAKHNVSNALAALCASVAMGIPMDAIRTGLSGFRSSAADNPGRLNTFSHNGAQVFVDYAHNPHSIAAVCDALKAIPAKRRFLMISQPGDRSDQDIAEAMITALTLHPDEIVVAEIADYLRGRVLNETPDLLIATATATGMQPAQIMRATSPSSGAKLILDQAMPDDLVLLLVLSDRDAVFDLLA